MRKDQMTLSFIRSLPSARIIISAAILVFVATGLRDALQKLGKYYTKESISVRRSLKEFDISYLPSFQHGWIATNMPPQDIGTDQYIIMNLSVVGTSKKSNLALFATYYSDPGNKVPHTPDVCYRQGGAVVKKMKTITIDSPQLAPQYPSIPASLVTFEMADCDQVVIYSFFVEGKFRHKRWQVRWDISKPGNRYTYFSKIEVIANFPKRGNPTESIERCKKLFCETVSVLLTEYFPTNEQLKRH